MIEKTRSIELIRFNKIRSVYFIIGLFFVFLGGAIYFIVNKPVVGSFIAFMGFALLGLVYLPMFDGLTELSKRHKGDNQ